MKRCFGAVLITLAMIALVAGCSQGQPRSGTLVGTFIEAGGPAGFIQSLPGHIVARNLAGEVFTVTVGKGGHFLMRLPPGTYRLTGYSPLYGGGCIGGTARVRAGSRATHVQIVCVLA